MLCSDIVAHHTCFLGKMTTEWGMSEDLEDDTCVFSLQEQLLHSKLPIRVKVDGEDARYVFSEESAFVQTIRQKHKHHAEAILAHLLEAHGEFVGQSSAGTIVRVPWDHATNTAMSPASVIDKITTHLFP